GGHKSACYLSIYRYFPTVCIYHPTNAFTAVCPTSCDNRWATVIFTRRCNGSRQNRSSNGLSTSFNVKWAGIGSLYWSTNYGDSKCHVFAHEQKLSQFVPAWLFSIIGISPWR